MSAPGAKPQMIFLSHAGAESEAAIALAALLRSVGIDVWLDVERLRPGDLWQREISSALANAHALILYVGRSGLAHWVDFEVQLALDRSAREASFRIIPVLGPGSNPDLLPHFVRLFQWLDFRQAQPSPEELGDRLSAILQPAAVPVSILSPERSPFAGLHAFDVDDALLFFGRETETEELLECLRRDSLLLVVGDSGCGKSSLVRAGLVPALLRGRFHDGSSWVHSWRVAITRPGNDPFGELAEDLPDLETEGGRRAEQVSSNRKLLADGVDGLRDIIAGAVPAGARALLVVDQFEELFTASTDPALRHRYIGSLLRAATAGGDRPLHVVLTLRADFYARCWEHPELPPRVAKNQYPVRHIRREKLRQMIERPLSLAGARAEPGLVETILAEVGEDPGNLALLEHTLDQLWLNRRVNGRVWITHEAYERLGRLSGALRRHANEAMERLPDDESRAWARQFFVELVQFGEGTEDTRRRVAIEDLLAAPGNREKAQRVLAQLASERLIITGREYVELAHEALIRAWPELRKWVDSERESVQLERRLVDDAREWDHLNRDPAALLAGGRLREASALLVSARRKVRPLVEEFIRESLRVRRNRRLRTVGIACSIIAVIGILLGSMIVQSMRNHLIQTATQFLDSNPPCSSAVALKVDLWHDNIDTKQLLEEAVQAASNPLLEHGGQGAVLDVAFSPNGETLATAGEDQTVRFWDAALEQQRAARGLLRLTDVDSAAPAISFSPDGTLLAAGTSSGSVRILKVPDGGVRFSLPGHGDDVTAICFGADGATLAVGRRSGNVSLWRLDATAPYLSFERPATTISALAFSPDGQRLAAGAQDGTAAIWLLSSGQLTLVKTPETSVDYLAFRPGGTEFLTATRLGGIHWWRSQGGAEIGTKASARDVTAAALSADGNVVSTSHRNHTLVIRDAVSLTPQMTIARQNDAVTKLALNRQGDRLAAANQLGKVRIYELNLGRLRTQAVQTIGQAKISQLGPCRDSVPAAKPKTNF